MVLELYCRKAGGKRGEGRGERGEGRGEMREGRGDRDESKKDESLRERGGAKQPLL